MVHLSRFAEELVLWMSTRFGFQSMVTFSAGDSFTGAAASREQPVAASAMSTSADDVRRRRLRPRHHPHQRSPSRSRTRARFPLRALRVEARPAW
jgi:hypothetical protein